MKTKLFTQAAIALTVITLTTSQAAAEPPKQSRAIPTSTNPVANPGKAAVPGPKTLDTKERNRLMNRMLELRSETETSEAAAAANRAEIKKIEKTLRAYFAERKRARELAASGKGPHKASVIGHIATRKALVTIRNGANGPVYEVRSRDGKTILAKELTLKQMQAFDPKLHAIVDRAMAGKKSPDGSFIDARRYPAPFVEDSANVFVTPPRRR